MHFDIPLTHPKPFMKNRIAGFNLQPLFSFLLVVTLLSSCRSNKDLTILRDVENNRTIAGSPITTPEYRIQINDNLYVSVISPNVDMNDLYNPAVVGNQRSINNVWQNLAGQYVQGYLVEPDGTVNLPAIGRIPVVGLTIPES
jgi:polysaccharide biosynthesis/export protein